MAEGLTPPAASFANKQRQARRLVNINREDLRRRTFTYNQLHHRLPEEAALRCADVYLRWLDKADYFHQREAIVVGHGTQRTLAVLATTDESHIGRTYRFLMSIVRAHAALPRQLTPLDEYVGLTHREKNQADLLLQVLSLMQHDSEDFFDSDDSQEVKRSVREAARDMPTAALQELLEFLQGSWGERWIAGKFEMRHDLRRLRETFHAKESFAEVADAIGQAVAEARAAGSLLTDQAAEALRDAVSARGFGAASGSSTPVSPSVSDDGASDEHLQFALDTDE